MFEPVDLVLEVGFGQVPVVNRVEHGVQEVNRLGDILISNEAINSDVAFPAVNEVPFAADHQEVVLSIVSCQSIQVGSVNLFHHSAGIREEICLALAGFERSFLVFVSQMVWNKFAL